MSDTPRVDAMSVVGYGEGGIESSYGFRCVPIEDARQLERENAELRKGAIGEIRNGQVVWFNKNPHAYGNGTVFYAVESQHQAEAK